MENKNYSGIIVSSANTIVNNNYIINKNIVDKIRQNNEYRKNIPLSDCAGEILPFRIIYFTMIFFASFYKVR